MRERERERERERKAVKIFFENCQPLLCIHSVVVEEMGGGGFKRDFACHPRITSSLHNISLHNTQISQNSHLLNFMHHQTHIKQRRIYLKLLALPQQLALFSLVVRV